MSKNNKKIEKNNKNSKKNNESISNGNVRILRPNFKVKFGILEKIMIAITIISVTLIWIYVIFNISKLPNLIPTHFAMNGKPNSWGSRNTILIMPIMCTITSALLIGITRFPKFFNYQVEITKDNVERQYRNSIDLMLALAIEVAGTFIYIEYKMIKSALGMSNGIGSYFLIIFMVIIFITIFYFTRRMRKIG